MFVSKEFTFDAAHFLTKYHGKCERLHGHTYRLRVTVEGPVREDGMVMDFVDLKKCVKDKVIDRYDHQNLNDFFENPSAELVAKKIWEDLLDELPVKLSEVTLWETAESFVTYRGD
ncbi:6-carboxytetrahydropterin synthase QueD [Candidatus Peregrinibacteria bacterium]|nr:MAG: 6-carboxytetrahydropterin synthase QueD [Candidatus Peregrinibacteria bacterium]